MKQQHKYRTQINQRTITPSEDSWERLNKKLSAQENIQKRKKWMFLKSAASILMLVSVGFYFFQPKNKISITTTSEEQKIKLPVINQASETLIAIPIKTLPIITIAKKKLKTPIVVNSKIEENEKIQNKTIAEETKIFAKNLEKTVPIEKANNLITEVLNEEVTDNEIEQLLNKAKINIKLNPQNLSKNMVNANTLLLEVEDDLDKDFKQKIFESIVKHLNGLKEVVANNEN